LALNALPRLFYVGIGHFQMRSFPFPVMPRGTFVFFARVPVRELYAIVRASLGRSKQVGQRGGPLYRSILPTSGPRLMIGVDVRHRLAGLSMAMLPEMMIGAISGGATQSTRKCASPMPFWHNYDPACPHIFSA